MHFDIIRRWKETTEGECNSARYGFIVNAAIGITEEMHKKRQSAQSRIY